jgi:hypothetical protein
MRVGVLADTHIHSLNVGIKFAEKLLNGSFSDVDRTYLQQIMELVYR